MSYQIDAWLERSEPELRVTVKSTGLEIMRWQGDQLRELMENGWVDARDFYASAQQTTQQQQELVRDLFLIACLEEQCH